MQKRDDCPKTSWSQLSPETDITLKIDDEMTTVIKMIDHL